MVSVDSDTMRLLETRFCLRHSRPHHNLALGVLVAVFGAFSVFVRRVWQARRYRRFLGSSCCRSHRPTDRRLAQVVRRLPRDEIVGEGALAAGHSNPC